MSRTAASEITAPLFHLCRWNGDPGYAGTFRPSNEGARAFQALKAAE